jgi:hypothetical protein
MFHLSLPLKMNNCCPDSVKIILRQDSQMGKRGSQIREPPSPGHVKRGCKEAVGSKPPLQILWLNAE